MSRTRAELKGKAKRCSSCLIWYPATSLHFRFKARGLGGLDNVCILCREAKGTRRIDPHSWSRSSFGEARAKRLGRKSEHISSRFFKTLYAEQKAQCFWCERSIAIEDGGSHVDHYIPLSDKRGTHTRGNVVLACPACNGTKSDLLPLEWLLVTSKSDRRLGPKPSEQAHSQASAGSAKNQ